MNTDTRQAHRKLIFLGTHGYVLALEKEKGREVWRTSLPGTGYSIVSIIYEDGQLLCASGGHAFGLDPENGEILWHNNLAGLGHGLIYMTTVDSPTDGMQATLAAQSAADAQAASAAT